MAKILDVYGTWRDVANSARTTIGLEAKEGEVSSSWKKRMLLCEHSPTRKISISWIWESIPYWVSTHFVRHKFGIEHWVSTQRSDRTGKNRDLAKQSNEVIHEAQANAQSIINISRRRLCSGASVETRREWNNMLDKLIEIEPELAGVCVPDCIYRGHCYEYKPCGYSETDEYKTKLEEYRRIN